MIDRRNLLTGSVSAWAAVTLTGCSDDVEGGGTGGMGGAAGDDAGAGGSGDAGEGGSPEGGMTSAGGSTSIGGRTAGGASGSNGESGNSGESGSSGEDGSSGEGGMTSAGGSTSSGGASGRSSGSGGRATGGRAAGGRAAGGASAGGAETGGSGGAGIGGMAGMGGTLVCQTNTDNGMHAHPVTVPGSDVKRGFQDAPYLLEDGGTGHTHTLELSAYDFSYLSAGLEVSVESTLSEGHKHLCVVSCAPG